jgi:hypothetical protein
MFVADEREVGEAVRAADTIAAFVSAFEPERYSGDDATTLVSLFARIERLGAAGKGLAARRVEETKTWKGSGARNAAEWLGRTTGSTAGQAAQTLTTSWRRHDQPDLDAAVRAGALSGAQAAEIAQAAGDDPASTASDRHSVAQSSEKTRQNGWPTGSR